MFSDIYRGQQVRSRLVVGTKVTFNIAQGLATGTAVISDSRVEVEDGKEYLYYRLDVLEGNSGDAHRNKEGELWVNDFEAKAIR